MIQKQDSGLGKWKFLIIVLLLFGIVVRTADLDRKVYWYDETFTSLRISGYTEAEAVRGLASQPVVSPEMLQAYQKLKPSSTLLDTVASLAVEDPQHPPLYYGLARIWAKVFGFSVAGIRSLSVLFSLLVFPALYWLCWELFGREETINLGSSKRSQPAVSLIRGLAIALMAVSPFHLLYAQEARQYSLWTLLILVASAALLRATRLRTRSAWLLYAVTLILSFYTFLFSVLVAIGHAVYVVLSERKLTRTLANFGTMTAIASALSAPWFWTVLNGVGQIRKTTGWAEQKSERGLMRSWAVNLNRIFFDLNPDTSSSTTEVIFLGICALVLLILVGYAIYFLWRSAPFKPALFLYTLMGTTAIATVGPDLLLGGMRSSVPRYLIPCFLGIQITLAYLFAAKLSPSLQRLQRRRFWQVGWVVLLALGVYSCGTITQAQVWWTKVHDLNTVAIANVINQPNRSLVISDARTAELLSLSYWLKPEVMLMVKPQCTTCSIQIQPKDQPYLPNLPAGFDEVFLFYPRPSKAWLRQLDQQPLFRFKTISNQKNVFLWKILGGQPVGIRNSTREQNS